MIEAQWTCSAGLYFSENIMYNMTDEELERWKRHNPGTPLNPNPLDDGDR